MHPICQLPLTAGDSQQRPATSVGAGFALCPRHAAITQEKCRRPVAPIAECERVASSSPEGASPAGRQMPVSVSGDRLLVGDPTGLGPYMAVQCESKPRRHRPRVITRLSTSAPPLDKNFEPVTTEPM